MLKKFAITFGIFIFVLYGLFLLAPMFLTGFINNYDIPKIVEDACGYKLKIEDIKLVTTPKLTVGAKVGHIDLALPTGESFLTADNINGKLSLIPLLARKIEIDTVGADNINLNLKIKKDGHFLIEDYIPQSEPDKAQEPLTSLPLGLKLSNHLPDIKINNYNISFIDNADKTYSVFGNKFYIQDFILNKKVKITADGKFQLLDREQFSYDIKLLNKIMPDVDLNDIVFAPQTEPAEQTAKAQFINITDIFKAIYTNRITADLIADVKTSGTLENINFDGKANISNISVGVDGKPLPPSNADIKLSGNKIKLYAKLFTSKDEITEIVMNSTTGKSPKIDLNCKSNAKFKSVIDLADSIAKTFGRNDLDTITATGGIDADFSIKTDLKKLETSGYLKIPSASLNYKLYNANIEKIFADIQFPNNVIEIKDAGFTVMGQPLTIKGTVSHDAFADIKVMADKLRIKELLVAVGQAGLLKDNNVTSGTVSLDVILKGKLDKIVPKANISVDILNIKNIPMNITVSTPSTKLSMNDKDILINNSDIFLNKSKFNLSGKVSDYISKNINFDIDFKGNLLANDVKTFIPKEFRSEVTGAGAVPLSVKVTGNDKTQDVNFKLSATPTNHVAILSINDLKGKTTDIKGDIKINGDSLTFADTGIFANGTPIAYLKGGVKDLYKTQKLNLNFSTVKNISMVIPFFKKSGMVIGLNVDITGNALNPYLKGSVNIPSMKIPEMLTTLEDLNVSLNGLIARGKSTLKKLTSGGIVAENLTTDFNLTNNILYLKNFSGDAFEGKTSGNISYNIINGHIGVEIKGAGMNAEKAIAGAAGIKNALSGKLGFNANVTLHGATDIEMIKNLKGKASFEITDGELGNVGRFENLILAQNLMSNPVLKAGIQSIRALPTIKNTSKFKTINGNLTFSNGWTDLAPVKMSGETMAYYITGKYNLLNGSANVVILGRISAEVVKLLGPLGELSLSKLVSYIPGIGSATAKLVQAITTNPYGEKISEIPALSSGNTNYKDFKVQFNGGVESTSSVKSFKWLSVCDTSEIESMSLKEQIQYTKDVMKETKEQIEKEAKEAVQKKIDAVNQEFAQKRQEAQQANQELKNSVEGLKNLFKAPKQEAKTPAQTTETPETKPENPIETSDTNQN